MTASRDLAGVRFYSRLLRLYPKAHRDAFGEQMLQTFRDSYRERTEGTGHASMAFWLDVIWDEGRSIVREHTTASRLQRGAHGLPIAILALLPLAILTLPGVVASDAWPVLLVVAGATAGLFLWAPGYTGVMTRSLTVLVAIAVVAGLIVSGQSLNDVGDTVAPGLWLACFLFAAKAVVGWMPVRDVRSLAVWSPIELAYALLLGLTGVGGLVFAAATQADFDAAVKLVFYLVVPLLSVVAGTMAAGRREPYVAALVRGSGPLLVGAGIWMVARPAIAGVALHTGLLGVHGSATGLLTGWAKPFGSILFFSVVLCTAAAALRVIAREEHPGKIPA